jgi:glycosyltransferase involved in cell wall biosynthesis
MSHPLISIITPSLNRAQFIHEAIQSVLDQSYSEVEHIIIDAASTDGTLEILSRYPHLRVISEPDKGMYDAINKGIRMAKGEIIGLLNTDDMYAPGCFDEVITAFEINPSALAVCGGISVFEDRDGRQEFISHAPAIEAQELWYRLIQGHPVTNAWFFRKKVFDQAGYFDADLRYSADRYYLIKIALDNAVRPLPIDRILCYYRKHGDSATMTTLDSREAKYALLRIRILWEDIAALEHFLRRNNLPNEVRWRMRREHSERCYRLAATALYHNRWRDVLNAVISGFKINKLWLLVFFEMSVRRLRIELVGDG